MSEISTTLQFIGTVLSVRWYIGGVTYCANHPKLLLVTPTPSIDLLLSFFAEWINIWGMCGITKAFLMFEPARRKGSAYHPASHVYRVYTATRLYLLFLSLCDPLVEQHKVTWQVQSHPPGNSLSLSKSTTPSHS